jgi:hypothetical protein
VPDADYHFVNWSDSSTANPRTDSNVRTNLSLAASFVVDVPKLSGISPANGPAAGGTSVTISGSALLDVSSVTFGGIEATIDSSFPTSLIVTSPVHPAGLVTVVVTTPGGSSNAKTFSYDAPLETWRQKWFGPAATNTGDAANNADPRRTGIPNLLVFAFFGLDQDPATTMINQLPQATNNADFFTYQFTEPAGVSGVSYGAESSISLENEDWLLVTDTGSETEHIFSVPMDSSKKVPASDGRAFAASGRSDLCAARQC